MEQLLTYGLLNNELKHISEVENGLACNCICPNPNCKHPLVAKNNPSNIKAGHFAHHSGKECGGAIETALHLLAKTILLKTKKIRIPKYHFDYNPSNEKSVFRASREIVFENIFLEKQIIINGDKIIPDAICEINNKQVFIEFANTHFVDEKKKTKLKQLGTACVEINLKEQILDEESLNKFLLSDTPHKYWIVNNRLDLEYNTEKFKRLEKEKERLDAEKKLLENQEIIEKKKREEVEKREFDNDYKKRKYQNKKQFKLLLADENGKVSHCPLKKDSIKVYTTSPFYRHPILKQIIDGEYWNGEFYGRTPNGKNIYVGKNKITVFPPNDRLDEQSETEKKMNNFLFAGLQEIYKTMRNSEFGNCVNCKFYIDSFYIENKDYNVCAHI